MKRYGILASLVLVLCLSACKANYFDNVSGPHKIIVLKFKEGMYCPDKIYSNNAQYFGPGNPSKGFTYPPVYYHLIWGHIDTTANRVQRDYGLYPLEDGYYLATRDWAEQMYLFDVSRSELNSFADSTIYKPDKAAAEMLSDDIYEYYYTRDNDFHPGESLGFDEYSFRMWEENNPPLEGIEKINKMIRQGVLHKYFDQPLEGKYHRGIFGEAF